MEKREQRVRRDRRRDGKRNTFQNEQGRETIKQRDSSVEKKKNDAPNVEVSNKTNSSEDKVKSVEDDPLRFANLKRETDEIAALKAKKPLKRQVFSNWAKYEEPLPSQDESRAVDFESLLHAPQSGGFRFKSEQQWDSGSYGQFGELFTPDAELLVGGLTSVPFYERLGIGKALFSEDELQRMDCGAKANYVAYEKLKKSKPKPKVAISDLFKISQAEKYAVTDEANGPSVELSTSTSKPVFSVEEAPEASPAEVSLSVLAAGGCAEQSDRGRGFTVALESAPSGAERDLKFGKPPPSPYGWTERPQSRTPDRERTPLRDAGRDVASPELTFERAPPPLHTSGNVRSPFHSRESTPAKETLLSTVSLGSGGPRTTDSRSGSEGREGVPDPAAPPIREKETVQKLRDGRPTVASTSDVPSENGSRRGGTPARDRQSPTEDHASREASPVQKVVDDRLPVAAFASSEIKRPLDKIVSNSEMLGREEIAREPVLQRDGSGAREERTREKSPRESDAVSERRSAENEQIGTENGSYSKKSGKPDGRKPEGQQRGGGRHGRRKKGQNAAARAGEQLQMEAGGARDGAAEPEAESSAPAAAKSDAPGETGHEELRPAEGMDERPEQLPPSPPSAPQQEQRTVETAARQAESRSKPKEPKSRQVMEPAVPPDSQAQLPQKKTAPSVKTNPAPKERGPGGRGDDDGLNFLMSLRGQKTGGVSEVEAAKSAAGAAVARSAIEEDEMKESQKPKPPPVIATEKKEDLEDWLDSMLDD